MRHAKHRRDGHDGQPGSASGREKLAVCVGRRHLGSLRPRKGQPPCVHFARADRVTAPSIRTIKSARTPRERFFWWYSLSLLFLRPFGLIVGPLMARRGTRRVEQLHPGAAWEARQRDHGFTWWQVVDHYPADAAGRGLGDRGVEQSSHSAVGALRPAYRVGTAELAATVRFAPRFSERLCGKSSVETPQSPLDPPPSRRRSHRQWAGVTRWTTAFSDARRPLRRILRAHQPQPLPVLLNAVVGELDGPAVSNRLSSVLRGSQGFLPGAWLHDSGSSRIHHLAK